MFIFSSPMYSSPSKARHSLLIGMEAMRQAVFYYRAAANNGKLNLPRIREYCKALPKGEKYREKIRREIL